jgi:hypothetical protein
VHDIMTQGPPKLQNSQQVVNQAALNNDDQGQIDDALNEPIEEENQVDELEEEEVQNEHQNQNHIMNLAQNHPANAQQGIPPQLVNVLQNQLGGGLANQIGHLIGNQLNQGNIHGENLPANHFQPAHVQPRFFQGRPRQTLQESMQPLQSKQFLWQHRVQARDTDENKNEMNKESTISKTKKQQLAKSILKANIDLPTPVIVKDRLNDPVCKLFEPYQLTTQQRALTRKPLLTYITSVYSKNQPRLFVCTPHLHSVSLLSERPGLFLVLLSTLILPSICVDITAQFLINRSPYLCLMDYYGQRIKIQIQINS